MSEHVWDLRVAVGDEVQVRGEFRWRTVTGMEVFQDRGGSLGGAGFELLLSLDGNEVCRTVYYHVTGVRRNGIEIPTHGLGFWS